MALLSVEEALARILARVPAPSAESVPLAEAAGRVLVLPVVAGRDQPPFNASSMDGYAVRASDTAERADLRVIGVAQAGARFEGRVEPGTAVRIFTGAPVPDGADAVILQEEAERDGDLVRFGRPARPGESLRPQGYDFRAGAELLPAGTLLTPGALVAAAAANAATLVVARRPRLALLSNGDELVLPGGTPGPDGIFAANAFGLRAQLAPYAAEVRDFGIVPDRPEALAAALAEVFAFAPDLLVTSGGASVGERDYLREALTSAGVELDLWRVAMRPGKPVMFGARGATLVFGLPGNPASALVGAEILVKPALRRWLGLPDVLGPRLRLPLATALPPNGPRRNFLRAALQRSGSVSPFAEADSGHTGSLARADLLVIQPENAPAQAAGETTEVIPLGLF